ncbi:hypothetical protein PSAC2689_50180 [Paraburkholderia sacchari]
MCLIHEIPHNFVSDIFDLRRQQIYAVLLFRISCEIILALALITYY